MEFFFVVRARDLLMLRLSSFRSPGRRAVGERLTTLSQYPATRSFATTKLYSAEKDKLSDSKYDLPPDAGYCTEKTETRAFGRFKDKTIIVTGAAGNFGAKCAERFASEGAKIVSLSTSPHANPPSDKKNTHPTGSIRHRRLLNSRTTSRKRV